MPANRFNGNSDYGIGIGLRIPHYRHIFEHKPVVNWFEIISENFMVDAGRPLAVLDRILERYRVVQHGVSMYFGSAEPLNREHLRRLKRLVRRTKTPWLTDHLCWGSVDGRYTHDLLPMPYTFEAAEVTARKIREARDFLEVPIAVENVSSYAEFHVSEMTEWQFLNEVVERADCGILLDVNASVVRDLEPLIAKSGAHFVGSHPMAGAEKTGVSAARADLFANTVCIVTPTKKTNPGCAEKGKTILECRGFAGVGIEAGNPRCAGEPIQPPAARRRGDVGQPRLESGATEASGRVVRQRFS